MSKKLVREMWDQIGHKAPVFANPDETIFEASRIQVRMDVGALIIVSEHKLVGVLSERDIVRKVDANGLDRFETTIDDVMTEEVVFITTTTILDECKKLMSEKGIRHLPVVDNGKVVGIVSMLDLIKSDEYDARVERDHMEGYLRRTG